MNSSAVPPALSAVQDFPDRLPAMLVKELRQGMRARGFAEFIAGFHLTLIFVLTPELMSGPTTPGNQKLLWWLVTAVVVVLIPSRGLSALFAERRAQTLDMLLLTNLQAGRIVWGKWLAIFCQALIAAISVLPYILVLLYTGGSAWQTLSVLVRLLLAGGCLGAALVALSANPPWLTRAVPAFLLILTILNLYAWPHSAVLTGRESLHPFLQTVPLWLEIVGAIALITVLLESTAARIAPPSESHHTLPFLAAAITLPVALVAVPAAAVLLLAVLTLVSLQTLTRAMPAWQEDPENGLRLPMNGSSWPWGLLRMAALWTAALALLASLHPDWLLMGISLASWIFGSWLVLGIRSPVPRLSAFLGLAAVLLLVQGILAVLQNQLAHPVPGLVARWLPFAWQTGTASPSSLLLAAVPLLAATVVAILTLLFSARAHRRQRLSVSAPA